MWDNLTPKEKIIKARIKLQESHPFFGYILMNMEPEEGENLPSRSIGTDWRGGLFYDPNWIDSLAREECEAVLCHEALHVALKHLWRRGDRKVLPWGFACDIVVNTILSENGFKIPEEGVHPSSEAKGKSVEEVYEELDIPYDEFELSAVGDIYSQEGDSSQAGGSKYEQESEGEGEEKTEKETPEKGDQAADTEGEDENEKSKGESEVEREIEEQLEEKFGKRLDEHIEPTEEEKKKEKAMDKETRRWEDVLVQAHTYAKMQGFKPAGMEQIIESVIEEKFDWRSLLRQYVQKEIPFDFTFSKPSKKSKSMGVYLPDVRRESVDIAVALDTSGSISKKELSEFLGEVKGILKSYSRVNATLIQADATVQDVREITDNIINELEKVKIKGRGGTDHRPVFKWIEENKPDCNLLICLTDGYTTFPENDYAWRTIWVSTKKEVEHYPFGRALKLECF